MLCGTADVVDPELMQPGCTPPEGSGPLSVLPRVCRAEVRCRRVFPVWKSSFSPRHSGYIESRTCRVAERERTAEKQVRCQYRLTTASTCHGSDKRSRSTCRTWNRCQSQYEEADDEICRIPFVVAREVQCDGRMAMEIERAGVQDRLHPLMVSVPVCSCRRSRSGGEIVVVLFNLIGDRGHGDGRCVARRSDGGLLWCVDSVKTFPALGLTKRKSPIFR